MTARRSKNKPQPQLNKQLDPTPSKPAKEKDEVAIEFGKFLLDLAKLTFGGMFLTAIMDLSTDVERMIAVCAVVIVFISALGFIFIRKGNKKT